MAWYEYIFIGMLLPFSIVLFGAAIASLILAYNIAVMLIQAARNKI